LILNTGGSLRREIGHFRTPHAGRGGKGRKIEAHRKGRGKIRCAPSEGEGGGSRKASLPGWRKRDFGFLRCKGKKKVRTPLARKGGERERLLNTLPYYGKRGERKTGPSDDASFFADRNPVGRRGGKRGRVFKELLLSPIEKRKGD